MSIFNPYDLVKLIKPTNLITVFINAGHRLIQIYGKLPTPLKMVTWIIFPAIMPVVYAMKVLPQVHSLLSKDGAFSITQVISYLQGVGMPEMPEEIINITAGIYNLLQIPYLLTIYITIIVPVVMFRIGFRAVKSWIPTLGE